MTGGFSRAIHLIESEKGWNTEYVLSRPICRIRQLLELISQEKRDEMKVQAALVEWQTRNICSMFAVMAEDKKQAKAIQRAVEKMKLPLADEEADIMDNRSFEEVIEQGAQVDYANQPSFEALSSAFENL